MQNKTYSILKQFPDLQKFSVTKMKKKEQRIFDYLQHFLLAKKIERVANEGESYAEAICKGMLVLNFPTPKPFLTYTDAQIRQFGKGTTLLKIASLINCPRETVRRKAVCLIEKKFIQKKGEHQFFITKKWLHRSMHYLLLMGYSGEHLAAKLQKKA